MLDCSGPSKVFGEEGEDVDAHRHMALDAVDGVAFARVSLKELDGVGKQLEDRLEALDGALFAAGEVND